MLKAESLCAWSEPLLWPLITCPASVSFRCSTITCANTYNSLNKTLSHHPLCPNPYSCLNSISWRLENYKTNFLIAVRTLFVHTVQQESHWLCPLIETVRICSWAMEATRTTFGPWQWRFYDLSGMTLQYWEISQYLCPIPLLWWALLVSTSNLPDRFQLATKPNGPPVSHLLGAMKNVNKQD